VRLRELALCTALALPVLAPAAPVTPAEVQQAVAAVKRHPDLGGTVTEKSLRWKQNDQPADDKAPGQLKWLAELVRRIAETGRVLVWLVGAALVALLLVGIRRWILVRGGSAPAQRAVLPSHVQDLDIRPESLPDAIGAAAAQLWQRGEPRAALSLLYRGALSRLVHAHAVPIRAASTEGECVALAQARLDAQRSAFFARLVQAWQLAVYGARLPAADEAIALCRAFDLQWPAQAAGLRA
jgi:hypothetical protein